MKDKLTASEAIYGFCGWVTTRKEKVVASEEHDSSVWAELAGEFIKTNGLKSPRKKWYKNLKHPLDKKRSKRDKVKEGG